MTCFSPCRRRANMQNAWTVLVYLSSDGYCHSNFSHSLLVIMEPSIFAALDSSQLSGSWQCQSQRTHVLSFCSCKRRWCAPKTISNTMHEALPFCVSPGRPPSVVAGRFSLAPLSLVAARFSSLGKYRFSTLIAHHPEHTKGIVCAY